MGVVAFLASIVDPKVAAAAAGSAAETLKGNLKSGANGSTNDAAALTDVQKAANVAITAASHKAGLLASEEDKELHKLTRELVDAQLAKLDLKMKHFDALESLLEIERRSLEQQKMALMEERLSVAAQAHAVKDTATRISTLAMQTQAAMASHSAVPAMPADMVNYVASTGATSGQPSRPTQVPVSNGMQDGTIVFGQLG